MNHRNPYEDTRVYRLSPKAYGVDWARLALTILVGAALFVVVYAWLS